MSLTVNLDAGMALDAVASTSHKLVTERPASDGGASNLPTKRYPPTGIRSRLDTDARGKPFTAFFHEAADNDVYVLAMIMPQIRRATFRPAQARDIVFILDRSGSMGGEPIRAARAALDTA